MGSGCHRERETGRSRGRARVTGLRKLGRSRGGGKNRPASWAEGEREEQAGLG
jgi:hypothetical protein